MHATTAPRLTFDGLIARSGKTAEQVAEEAMLSRVTIWRWATGDRIPRPGLGRRFARAVGATDQEFAVAIELAAKLKTASAQRPAAKR